MNQLALPECPSMTLKRGIIIMTYMFNVTKLYDINVFHTYILLAKELSFIAREIAISA